VAAALTATTRDPWAHPGVKPQGENLLNISGFDIYLISICSTSSRIRHELRSNIPKIRMKKVVNFEISVHFSDGFYFIKGKNLRNSPEIDENSEALFC
jgi:hypothetical protein